MLQTLHRLMHSGKPIYGMHRGTVGFLMNEYSERRPAGAAAAAEITVIHPLLMRAHDVQRAHARAPRHQRSVAVPPELSGGAPAHPDRRQGAARRTGRRRRAGLDAGRLHRLQSFRPGTDHPDQCAAAGADADQPVPAAALARRAAARHAQVTIDVLEPDKRPVAAVADHDEVRSVARSTSAWITRSRCTCCSTRATAWKSASCASSSG